MLHGEIFLGVVDDSFSNHGVGVKGVVGEAGLTSHVQSDVTRVDLLVVWRRC